MALRHLAESLKPGEEAMAESTLIAVGVDGAPKGWMAACLYAYGGDDEHYTRLVLCDDISDVADLHDGASGQVAIAIDVPIGLPETVVLRRCDQQARFRLGERRNTVFPPPARYMLAAAGDYPRLRELVEEERRQNPAAKSLSAQAAGLTPKIAEVDTFARSRKDSEEWLWECHPELSFCALNGGVPCQEKYRAAGVLARLRLLRPQFPDLEEQLARAPWSAKQASLADMLDAYAALTTALDCARGEHEELGEGERDDEGLPMRMAV